MKRYAISKNGKYATTEISLRIHKEDKGTPYGDRCQMAVHSNLIGQTIFGTITRKEASEILKNARIERLRIRKTEESNG